MGKRMQLLVAPGCICLLLLLVPSGYSNFDRYWRMFDMRTATKLEHKHFCPHCATEADAAQYSIDRNTYCQRNGCLETGKNTVFVASLPSQQGNWARAPCGGRIYSQARFDTYICNNVPTSMNPHPPGAIYCLRKWTHCYAGPFFENGHLDSRNLICNP